MGGVLTDEELREIRERADRVPQYPPPPGGHTLTLFFDARDDVRTLLDEIERLRAAAWSVVRSSFPDKGEIWTHQERVLLDVLEGRDPDAILYVTPRQGP